MPVLNRKPTLRLVQACEFGHTYTIERNVIDSPMGTRLAIRAVFEQAQTCPMCHSEENERILASMNFYE